MTFSPIVRWSTHFRARVVAGHPRQRDLAGTASSTASAASRPTPLDTANRHTALLSVGIDTTSPTARRRQRRRNRSADDIAFAATVTYAAVSSLGLVRRLPVHGRSARTPARSGRDHTTLNRSGHTPSRPEAVVRVRALWPFPGTRNWLSRQRPVARLRKRDTLVHALTRAPSDTPQ